MTGLRHFTKGGYERASKRFEKNGVMSQEGSLQGKICMVTGANQGLGFQISVELAKRGSCLYMVCRNRERGNRAQEEVKKMSKNENVHLLVCDISSLGDIKLLGEEYVNSGKPLDVLIHNAGVLLHGGEEVSVDGHELNFATNTLGTYALTKALEPSLKKSKDARVVFMSSGGALTSHLEVDDLENTKSRLKDGSALYARDKRRQIAMAEYFSELWKKDGIFSCSMHPGWVETEGVKTSIPQFYNTFKSKLRTLEQGADTAVWLAVSPVERLTPGGFYLDRSPQSKHLPLAGTKYSKETVETLIQRLDSMMIS